jgi:DNA-binding response OmpR family regulator
MPYKRPRLQAMTPSSKRVLIIEPSRFMRKLLEVHVQAASHQVHSIESYAAALEWLSGWQGPDPDLAFVALEARPSQSWQVLRTLRWHSRSLLLVAIVAQQESTQQAVQRLVQETSAVLVCAPFRIQEVLALCHAQAVPQPPGCLPIRAGIQVNEGE